MQNPHIKKALQIKLQSLPYDLTEEKKEVTIYKLIPAYLS